MSRLVLLQMEATLSEVFRLRLRGPPHCPVLMLVMTHPHWLVLTALHSNITLSQLDLLCTGILIRTQASRTTSLDVLVVK